MEGHVSHHCITVENLTFQDACLKLFHNALSSFFLLLSCVESMLGIEMNMKNNFNN